MTIDMKVMVTGADGFIGTAVCKNFRSRGVKFVGMVRRAGRAGFTTIGDISGNVNWFPFLDQCSAVVHLAARAHVVNERAKDPLADFRAVNVEGTMNLARQCASHGVDRFVFVSSIGVNGAETFEQPFSYLDGAAPHSPYALSKYEAEIGLQELAARTRMEVVIIRPPLVYGPNAPGNFASLSRWLQRGWPLPLGAINNRRSLVALDNLVDLITTGLTHPAAANQTFLVSDGEDISTTELLCRMGLAMNCPARLVSVPTHFLRMAAALVGRRDFAQRLCGSLQVDIQKTREVLGWNPPVTLDQGLKKAAEGFAT